MNGDISLGQVLETLIEANVIAAKRLGPLKTAVKQYAKILGYTDLSKCPIHVCFKPNKVRNRTIEDCAPSHLGINAVRNLKSNVSLFLRKTEELKIACPPPELASWKNSNDTRQMPKRNEHTVSPTYKLKKLPRRLENEIATYQKWSTSTVVRGRPKSLKKRPISFRQHLEAIAQACGYLVNYKTFRTCDLSLLSIVDPKNLFDYIEFRCELQGQYTKGVANALAHLGAIAHYLEITSEGTGQRLIINEWRNGIREFRASLGIPRKVHDQSKRWLTLSQLELVGKSIYPLNALRLSELCPATQYAVRQTPNEMPNRRYTASSNGYKRGYRTFRFYGLRVLQSLLIRLLVRIPLRQRNLREMLWHPSCPSEGRNLYKKDGVWRLRFVGAELKVEEVKGEVNSISYDFPVDLVELLEEWLYKWRRIIIEGQKGRYLHAERTSNEQEFAFLNSRGRPLQLPQVTTWFERATYKFTSVAVNPHMIRTIWATEYIKSTRNFADAAYMLGDTVETVIKTYAKLLDEDCSKRASEWINQRLSE